MFLLYFFAAFVLSWAIARFVRRRAIAVYQKQNRSPKAGVRIMPDGAGFAIVFTWLLMCVLLISSTSFMPLKLFLSMAPGAIVAFGFYQHQHRGLSPACTALLTMVGVGLGMYGLGGVDALVVGEFRWEGATAAIVMNVVAFAALFTLVYVFRNFDGIDGREGNLAAIVIAICVMSTVLARKNPMFFLIPCVAGFLVRNWHPARYLMGQGSAAFLGYVIGMFAIYFQSEELRQQNDGINFPAFLVMCLVPVFDVVYTAIRRRIGGEDISKPSKNYLYQRLLYSGFSHSAVIFTQLGLCGVMLVLVLVATSYQSFVLDVALLAVALLLMAFYAAWVEIRYPFVHEDNK